MANELKVYKRSSIDGDLDREDQQEMLDLIDKDSKNLHVKSWLDLLCKLGVQFLKVTLKKSLSNKG